MVIFVSFVVKIWLRYYLFNFLMDTAFTEDEFVLYFHAYCLCRADLGANAAALAIG